MSDKSKKTESGGAHIDTGGGTYVVDEGSVVPPETKEPLA